VSRRTERLGEEIREEVAGILASGLKDPRVGFVTVTRVEVTDDLHHARVYVGVLGDRKQRDATMQGLGQAAGWVRRELGRRIRVRYTPEVVFQYDEGLAATERVARLLEEAQPAGAAEAAPEREPEPDNK
jgi:ribosome-binding factor A